MEEGGPLQSSLFELRPDKSLRRGMTLGNFKIARRLDLVLPLFIHRPSSFILSPNPDVLSPAPSAFSLFAL